MIACRVYQWFMAHCAEPSDAFQRLRLARHLKECSDCRDYSHRLMRLEEQLRTSPAETLSPAQHARIQASVLSRLRQAKLSVHRPAQTTRMRRLLWIAGAAAAAAVFMVASDVYVSLHRHQLETPAESITLTALLADSEQLSRQLPQWTLLPEQSMQTELKKLANDTQQTVAFLLNCTPSHPGTDLDNGL